MKIAFAGTHSTGKTTLVQALSTEQSLSNFYFDVNVTRWVNSLGFTINQSASETSQEINLLKRIAHLNSYKNIIADRSIADVIAYSEASDAISAKSLAYQKDLFFKNIDRYDIIFYVPPVFQNVEDEVRPVDINYRHLIDEKVCKLLKKAPIDVKIYRIDKYSVRERLQEVMDVLNEFKSSN